MVHNTQSHRNIVPLAKQRLPSAETTRSSCVLWVWGTRGNREFPLEIQLVVLGLRPLGLKQSIASPVLTHQERTVAPPETGGDVRGAQLRDQHEASRQGNRGDGMVIYPMCLHISMHDTNTTMTSSSTMSEQHNDNESSCFVRFRIPYHSCLVCPLLRQARTAVQTNC